MSRLGFALVLASGLVLAPSASLAEDGVVEINQTCANQVGGCFSGDGQGLPVTINGGGGRSYRLTGDLAVTSANQTGIVVVASDVSLDLGGFRIRGGNVCSDAGCTQSGTGHGIDVAADRVRISNGSVVGMGSVGIFAGAGDGLVIQHVRVAHNRFQGISIGGAGSVVENAAAHRNGDVGIAVGVAARIAESVAVDNGLHGIQGAAGASIAGCSAYSNGLDGIFVENDAAVTDCASRENGRYGINIGTAALSADGRGSVVRCVSSRNGDSGIIVNNGVLVAESSIADNAGNGLQFTGNGGAYRANLITENGGAPVSGFNFINLGNNGCTDDNLAIVPCP